MFALLDWIVLAGCNWNSLCGVVHVLIFVTVNRLCAKPVSASLDFAACRNGKRIKPSLADRNAADDHDRDKSSNAIVSDHGVAGFRGIACGLGVLAGCWFGDSQGVAAVQEIASDRRAANGDFVSCSNAPRSRELEVTRFSVCVTPETEISALRIWPRRICTSPASWLKLNDMKNFVTELFAVCRKI